MNYFSNKDFNLKINFIINTFIIFECLKKKYLNFISNKFLLIFKFLITNFFLLFIYISRID